MGTWNPARLSPVIFTAVIAILVCALLAGFTDISWGAKRRDRCRDPRDRRARCLDARQAPPGRQAASEYVSGELAHLAGREKPVAQGLSPAAN